MSKTTISYYNDYLSDDLKKFILESAQNVQGIDGLKEVGSGGGLETIESLSFLIKLYEKVESKLNVILNQRIKDRKFIDERTKALVQFNKEYQRDFSTPYYQTILGIKDGEGRIVAGPLRSDYYVATLKEIAPIPEYFNETHVTLFGPPDNAKMSINAMNCYHRKLKDEPAIVSELLKTHKSLPKWGADDEDSKTPLRSDLISAGVNLTQCLEGKLEFEDQKKYTLAKDHRALPIKRFPGLALPSSFLFYHDQPIPLHLYDFALHLFHNYKNPKALAFYVPKLENEEEASYIRFMLETAEKMIQEIDSSYKMGTIRLMIVLENPRAVFRTNEIMDELYPYFMGASLGWHDFLGSTARLFKEDPHYRIPVKADPDIVIKYIKASHDLLAQVVGPRGGVKVGGMYGILPLDNDLFSESFQMTMKGYIKDVITQLKRDLSGFWVAHPDFMRIGLALVEAWKFYNEGETTQLESLVKSLLKVNHHQEILSFINAPDIQGLDHTDPMYARSLIVADLKESDYIANNHPDEIRYNVFQSLQYLTDWLCGNGCVALPSHVGGVAVRVMDDLATAERSRWEVWHEIYHGRFSLDEFLKICFEELHFIQKDLSNADKIVQVKWDERTEKWYPIALRLMIKLMTDKKPSEFATELLMSFTIDKVRQSDDPWKLLNEIDQKKFKLDPYIERFITYFSSCGSIRFAQTMSKNLFMDETKCTEIIQGFTVPEIIEAASFHGNIGEAKKSLEAQARMEQSAVLNADNSITSELCELGKQYLEKFGFKFLISARGKSSEEILLKLKSRLINSIDVEVQLAKDALLEITLLRLEQFKPDLFLAQINKLKIKYDINAVQFSVFDESSQMNKSLGVSEDTHFQVASLSKTIATAFAMEFFKSRGIDLNSKVNELFDHTDSTYRIPEGDLVEIKHLMNHQALNMHYVKGLPLNKSMPKCREFLEEKFGYEKVIVKNKPGSVFSYSGAGFIVLEHLIEAISNKSIIDLTELFLEKLKLSKFTFVPYDLPNRKYASGYTDNNLALSSTRLMFPSFAAGGLGTTESIARFLQTLGTAYHDVDVLEPLSHETAVMMCHGEDKGALKFIGAKIGLGVFIAQAQANKILIHQGANDGFRSLYFYCLSGPDQGKGFVVFANKDHKAMLFISEFSQLVLKSLNFSGIDYGLFKNDFDFEHLPAEEIINLGYKELIFNAFLPLKPSPDSPRGKLNSLASYSLVHEARICEVSNELFASADNLISSYDPTFDPELFGDQGKVMDSWETVRHNPNEFDYVVVKLKKPSSFRYVLFSTRYHLGNHAPYVSLEIFHNNQWITLLEKVSLNGHSDIRIRLDQSTPTVELLRVKIYPDGGLTRFRIFGENLPEEEKKIFWPKDMAENILFTDEIKQTKKPLSLAITHDDFVLPTKGKINYASFLYGAKVLFSSNEHYSPASQLLSPYPPLHMFDGLENARSRIPDNKEEVVIQLGKEIRIDYLELDFTFFVNNNPRELMIEGLSDRQWLPLVPKNFVKPFAGNKIRYYLNDSNYFSQLRVFLFPDGGINRIKVFEKITSFQ